MPQQLSQSAALEDILTKGKRHTLDQLVEKVGKKTKRSVTRQSLIVRISELRSAGMKISTFRGGASRAKDGAAQYQVV